MADILWHNQTLFKNPEVFDFAYIPESFEHRGGQLQAMADCIKPAFNNMKPINCKIIGETATGKTTSVKIVFNEAEKESSNIIFCHINCSISHNIFSLFSQIHKKVLGHTPPSSGFPLKDVYDNIMKKLKSSKKTLIIALDDAVYLEEINKVIYDLLRACEIYNTKVGVWIVGLPNELFALDEKTLSIFSPHQINFPKYTKEEIINILKKRADYGLYQNVISKQIIDKIANETLKKDLRFGIELLKSCVIEAENKSEKAVESDDFDSAFKKFSKIDGKETKDEKELIILNLLTQEGIISGELFEKLKDKMSYSSYYRLIDKLNKKGLISIEEKFSNTGRTRVIRPI
ncbi:AAA family ATPase [Candidatus Pacearchaeota archaeon]|nr:AAA family ATPase [Candidatus Pacearchaeota archaeon]